MADRVSVVSCAHGAWIQSSYTMGRSLAGAVGDGCESLVHVPVDAAGFAAVFSESELLILHTHGSAIGLYDYRTDGRSTTILTLEEAAALPRNPRLRFVMATACETAGGNPHENLAAALSRRISPDGILIASRTVVWGADTEFGAKDGACAWVAYRNGEILRHPHELPALLTMGDGYRIACELGAR